MADGHFVSSQTAGAVICYIELSHRSPPVATKMECYQQDRQIRAMRLKSRGSASAPNMQEDAPGCAHLEHCLSDYPSLLLARGCASSRLDDVLDSRHSRSFRSLLLSKIRFSDLWTIPRLKRPKERSRRFGKTTRKNDSAEKGTSTNSRKESEFRVKRENKAVRSWFLW
ncbi:hypothetical protein V1477_015377 [Vespula maculifrons]|uniref:Uncharacterized protein n=1 Tax=Vespula maculifrons TaxID=7453 RepID=A0ABD2BFN1_VESMC